MCRMLLVSVSGFYAWCKREESFHDREDRRLAVLVEEAYVRGRRTYGSPRVHAALAAKGVKVSRKRVIRLMQQRGLRGRTPRAFTRTTESVDGAAAAENLLNRDFTATAPNQKWVGDVTGLRVPEGWLYLAVLMDLYSRRIVGWALSPINDRKLALKALNAAVLSRQPTPGLLHHTDQGSPYVSEQYQEALLDLGATCSMSRRGNCHDNAAMESWNASMKKDIGEKFESYDDAHRKIFDYIEVFYNQVRIHSANDNRSPAEYERAGFA